MQSNLPEAQKRAWDKALALTNPNLKSDPKLYQDALNKNYEDNLKLEMQELNKKKDLVQNVTYGLNLPTLTASTVLQFGKMLRPDYVVEQKVQKDLIKKGLGETGKLVYKIEKPNKFLKAINLATAGKWEGLEVIS